MKRAWWMVAGVLWAGQWVNAQNGPIRQCAANPHYLEYQGRPILLVGSTEHYGAVMNLDFDFVRYLDEVKRSGLNQTRTFSGTYREVPSSFGITDNTLAPKNYVGPWPRTETAGGKDGNKFDLKKWDERYFQRLKEFVSEAGKRGIVVEYTLFCPFYEESLWQINSMNPQNNVNHLPAVGRMEVYTLKHKEYVEIHEAFVRKAVTELNGFENVYFEICNEPYFGGVMEDWQAHIAEVIVETEKELAKKHIIAKNIANGSQKVNKPLEQVGILNYHYATPPDTVGLNYGLNRMIGDDETGFRGKEDVHYRTEAWEFFIAGGGTYDNLDYSFTTRHPEGTLEDYKSPGGGSKALREQLRIMKTFLEGFEFVKMRPMNEVVKGGSVQAGIQTKKGEAGKANAWVRALGEEGKAYAIYVRGGTKAELELGLPPGKYRAEWVDTKSGKVIKEEELEGGKVSVSSPDYAEDIAMRVVAK